MSKKSRDKGKRGERAVIDWLQPVLNKLTKQIGVKPVLLQRNTVQSDRGGTDIIGLRWMGAEVKNCEKQNVSSLNDWWAQCVEQAEEWSEPGRPLTPVLFYTKAFAPIRVRLPGAIWCPHAQGVHVATMVDVSAEDFEAYFLARCRAELTPA